MPQLTQFWYTAPAPTNGDTFIYIGSPDKGGNRIVSKAYWREADEDRDEGYFDVDIGEEPDIAGWLPMPEFQTPVG